MADPTPSADRPERKRWLDGRRNADKIFYGLALICAGLLLADFFCHKHGNFAFVNVCGFFDLYGVIGCV